MSKSGKLSKKELLKHQDRERRVSQGQSANLRELSALGEKPPVLAPLQYARSRRR